MAISASDILFKLSTTSGSAGNSNSQGDPNASLGKYISTTQITDNSLNNLFDDVSGAENAASDVEYRCFFVHNAHASLTYQSAAIYISSEVSGGASIAIGIDTTAASAIGASPAQALTIVDESTAPSGVSFSSPTTTGGALSLGDIAAGQCRAVWVRRTAANSSAKNNDGATLTVFGDTAE